LPQAKKKQKERLPQALACVKDYVEYTKGSTRPQTFNTSEQLLVTAARARLDKWLLRAAVGPKQPTPSSQLLVTAAEGSLQAAVGPKQPTPSTQLLVTAAERLPQAAFGPSNHNQATAGDSRTGLPV
jgi:hypothetical protein